MPRADGRADGPPGWGVSSSRRLAGATPEELTAAQARDGIGAAVQVEEEQLRIRRSAAKHQHAVASGGTASAPAAVDISVRTLRLRDPRRRPGRRGCDCHAGTVAPA